MSAPSLSVLVPELERVAREAGAIALGGFRRGATVSKKGEIDLVTEYDLACEAHVVAELTRVAPELVIIGEEGKGLFHEATARVSAAYLMERGTSKNYIGYICYFLKNGDKVFTTFTAEIKAGTSTKGKAAIIGGTGACAGIQGSWEYSGSPLRPAAEGILQSYNRITIKYKLP